MRKLLLAMTIGALLLLGAQRGDQADMQLQAAINKEVVEGDLKGAIEQYKKIAQSGNRAVAAKALVRMGQCYEKLGNTESRKAYERILREFGDQREPVAQARARLATLAAPARTTEAPALAVRRVWTGADVDIEGAPSPDGRYLSFVDWATGDLAIRDLTTGENRRLTNKGSWEHSRAYALHSIISPDGQQVACSWCCTEDRFDLRLISVNGGPDGAKPRVLYSHEDVPYLQPSGWSPDGKHVLVILWRKDKSNQIVLISVGDGSVRVLKTLDWRYPHKMSFSPDGRYIVYDFPPKEDSPDRDIFVLASDGSRETPLVEQPGNDFVLGWAPDGNRILFASDRTGTIGAWAIGVADGKPQGPPQLVKPDVGHISPLGFAGKGAFYYGLESGLQDVYIATLDAATGKILAPPSPATHRFMGGNSSAAWSPNGQYIAYLSRRGPSSSLYGPRVLSIRSVKSGQDRELSHDLSEFYNMSRLRWSPDGRFLLASANDNKGRQGLYRIDAQTGEVVPLVQQGVSRFVQGVWSSDGKAIFYVHLDSTTRRHIRLRDLETGQEKELYRPASPSSLGNLALSPDGRWLAFGSAGGGSWEAEALLVMPAAGGEAREVLKVRPEKGSVTEGLITGVEWTADGTHLFFSKNSELWRIPAEGGQPQRLGLKTVPRMASLSVHPDGRRIAFTAGEHKEEVWVMENFLPGLMAAK